MNLFRITANVGIRIIGSHNDFIVMAPLHASLLQITQISRLLFLRISTQISCLLVTNEHERSMIFSLPRLIVENKETISVLMDNNRLFMFKKITYQPI